MTLLLLPQMLQPQMNILISSSGSWGQQVAHALNEWLPGVLAPVKSRMIEEDIVASPLNWQRSFLSHLNAPIAVIVCIPDKCVASHELYFQLGQIMGKNAPNPLYPFFVGVDRAAIPRSLEPH